MDNERNNKWPKYAVYSLIVIVVLLLILILFLYLIRSPLIFKSGASSLTPSSNGSQVNISSLSLDNSYIFASPLRAKTGGEKIRITVFILDTRGLGIAGKKVIVGGGNTLQVTPVQPVTDAQGRATFDIASDTSTGVYIMQAVVDGKNLVQTATITFD